MEREQRTDDLTESLEQQTATSESAEKRILRANMSRAADQFGRIARRFDLAIVGQVEPDGIQCRSRLVFRRNQLSQLL